MAFVPDSGSPFKPPSSRRTWTRARLRNSTPPSDRDVAEYVARVGFDRIVNAIGPDAALAYFDKLTAPNS